MIECICLILYYLAMMSLDLKKRNRYQSTLRSLHIKMNLKKNEIFITCLSDNNEYIKIFIFYW